MLESGTMNKAERVEAFEKHLREEHRQSPVTSYFKEIVYGGIDGIITTFAVVAGFSGAALSNSETTQLSFIVVLLFGLANLFADGVSMGLGNFLATRSDRTLYCSIRAKEIEEIRNNPDMELEETVTVLIQKGFSESDACTLADIYKTNESYWADFMMNHELQLTDATEDNPVYTGFATFLAFLFFGFIPLLPFVLFASVPPSTAFLLSSSGALLALILLGILKWRVTRSGIGALFEVVLVGCIAASVAYLVGTFFAI